MPWCVAIDEITSAKLPIVVAPPTEHGAIGQECATVVSCSDDLQRWRWCDASPIRAAAVLKRPITGRACVPMDVRVSDGGIQRLLWCNLFVVGDGVAAAGEAAEHTYDGPSATSHHTMSLAQWGHDGLPR